MRIHAIHRAAWLMLACLAFFSLAASSPQCSRSADPVLGADVETLSEKGSELISQCKQNCRDDAEALFAAEETRHQAALAACGGDKNCISAENKLNRRNVNRIKDDRSECLEDCPKLVRACLEACKEEAKEKRKAENRRHRAALEECGVIFHDDNDDDGHGDDDDDDRHEDDDDGRHEDDDDDHDKPASGGLGPMTGDRGRDGKCPRGDVACEECVRAENALHEANLAQIADEEKECKRTCHEQGRLVGGQ
jgi:hypothetical protein